MTVGSVTVWGKGGWLSHTGNIGCGSMFGAKGGRGPSGGKGGRGPSPIRGAIR